MIYPEKDQVGYVDEASWLKREMMGIIAHYLPDDAVVIDAFAGVGISAGIYAEKVAKVYAIEKKKEYYDILLKNCALLNNVEVIKGDNAKVMSGMAVKPVLVDLDPFGNCYEQLPIAIRLLQNEGVLCVTSGELYAIMRGTRLHKRYGDLLNALGTNKDFYLFPEKVLIPYILTISKFELVYYYVYPTSTRIIFADKVWCKLLRPLFDGFPRYLGFLSRYNKGVQRTFVK